MLLLVLKNAKKNKTKTKKKQMGNAWKTFLKS